MWERAWALAVLSWKISEPRIRTQASRWTESTFWRGVRVSGIDLRPGNVIEHAGKTMQVVSSQYTQGMGRGVGHVQTELKDLKTGGKMQQRFRSDDKVEKIALEQRKFDYLYDEGSTLVLMDPESFEQIHMNKELFGAKLPFLVEGVQVVVSFVGSEPVTASIPDKVTLLVTETEPPMKNAQANPGYKPAMLENGVRIQVPHFITAGDQIVVNTGDLSFQKRAK